MKKFISLFLACLMCFMVLPVNASSEQVYRESEIIHTEDGDIEVETILTVYPSVARNSTISADKTKNYYADGIKIATVTLSATFGYDWVGSWVDDASSSYSTYDGWSYKNESISTSGSTARLSAKLTKPLYSSHSVSISLKCSADGTVS